MTREPPLSTIATKQPATVTSRWSKSEIAKALGRKGFYVFPLDQWEKNPMLAGWPETATMNPDGWPVEANIGILAQQFGPDKTPMLVVDVDNKNGKAGDDSVLAWAEEGKIFPDTLRVNTPSGGYHLFFLAPYMVKNSAGKIANAVDVRSFHGFVVGMGSQTLKGIYLPANNYEIAPAPAWLMELVGRPEEGAASKEADGGGTAAVALDTTNAFLRASEYLRLSPDPADGRRNEMAFTLAATLKDFGLSEGVTTGLLASQWAHRGDFPITDDAKLASIVKNAYTYGHSPVGSRTTEAVFEGYTEETSAADITAPDKGDDEHPIKHLNRMHAFVMIGGKHAIIHERQGPNGIMEAALMDEGSFHAKYASLGLQYQGKVHPVTKLWMKSPDRRSFDGLVFRPGDMAPKGFYNMWKGFRWEQPHPDEDGPEAVRAVDMFFEHVERNICENESAAYRYLQAWMANIVRTPGDKPPVALVLRGGKGTGKNVFAETLGHALGDHLFAVVDKSRYLTGNFNAILMGKLLTVFDEAFWSGSKEAESALKGLVTGDTIQIEHKGRDPVTMENHMRSIILGNEKWLVPASMDERRFCVVDVGNGRRQDISFFAEMVDGMKAGGYSRLFRTLLTMDLPKVELRWPPATKALAGQKLLSLSIIEQWWRHFLLEGGMQTAEGQREWRVVVSLSEVHSMIRGFARDINASVRLPSALILADELRDINPAITLVRDTAGALAVRLPPLRDARAFFDKRVGLSSDI